MVDLKAGDRVRVRTHSITGREFLYSVLVPGETGIVYEIRHGDMVVVELKERSDRRKPLRHIGGGKVGKEVQGGCLMLLPPLSTIEEDLQNYIDEEMVALHGP